MGGREGSGIAGKLGSFLSRLVSGGEAPAQSDLVSTPRGAQMADAMAQARETLPVFWTWLDAHQDSEEQRAFKIGFPTRRKGVEYIWLTDIRRTGPLVSGVVSNDPEDVPQIKVGDIVPIDPETVADWTFRQGGLHFGHFTTRVLAASNPSMAAGLKTLSSTPLPDQVLQ